MDEPTFVNARPGDEVMAFPYGDGVIKLNFATDEEDLTHNTEYPIVVKFTNGKEESYTLDGRQFCGAKLPSLYWRGTRLCAAPPPKRKVKKTITRWFNIYPDGVVSCHLDHLDAEAVRGPRCLATVSAPIHYEVGEEI